MSDLRIRSIDEADFDTVIGEDIEFEGDLEFDHPVLFKGSIKGTIKSEASVYVSNEAIMEADINAATISVRGKIKGKLQAEKRIELFQDGEIEGEINSPDLIIQSGSRFQGTSNMPPINTDSESNPREDFSDS